MNYISIPEYHRELRQGITTCVETVRNYLKAIEANSHLNAFVEVFAEESLRRAEMLDHQEMSGRLHGVVIGIKDNILYKDHVSTAASRILEGFTSIYSSTAVERLLNEGAIIIGRQNCDEFGMGSTNENSAFGPVLNPLNNEHVAGGSSGGSAAAVAAGLCMVSLGSDTGGSVRLPADHCGVVGFKPSYGRISRYGLIAYGSSFDQIGILAKSVEDVRLVLDCIQGPDGFDATCRKDEVNPASDRKYRIAYFPEWLEHPSIDPEIAGGIKGMIGVLENQGHELAPVAFPLTDFIVPAYYVMTTAEASTNLSRYDGVRFGKAAPVTEDLASFYCESRSNGFGQEVKRRIMLGSFVLSAGYYEAYFSKAQQVRRMLKDHISMIFNAFDFIIAPNAPFIAPKLGEQKADPTVAYLGDIFTVFANLTGVPAISLPVFKHSSNLPFGLQVLSAEQNEVSLLRFSHQLMQQ